MAGLQECRSDCSTELPNGGIAGLNLQDRRPTSILPQSLNPEIPSRNPSLLPSRNPSRDPAILQSCNSGSSFKLTLAYDGTGFVGWQRQASGTSIQGLLELALNELDQREVPVVGAGRTDAGVHALGQVTSFTLQRTIDGPALVRALNARLPPAIRALDAEEVPASFHARFGARAKTYRYRLWNSDLLSPFERAYAWHLPGPALDLDAMAAAAQLVEGAHDFASFQSVGTELRSTDRTMFSSRIVNAAEEDRPRPAGERGRPALVTYEVRGDGFLRHMVRTLVGTLVEVGRGRRDVTWVGDVLAARDRRAAGPTAPAEGLFLVGVEYDRQL